MSVLSEHRIRMLEQQLERVTELYEARMGALYALQLRWRLEAERPAFGNRDEETLLSCAQQLQAVLGGADPNDEKLGWPKNQSSRETP